MLFNGSLHIYPHAQASRVMYSGWCPCIYIRECGSTLYAGLIRTAIQTSGYSNLKSTITFLALVSERKSISGALTKPSFLAIFHQRVR